MPLKITNALLCDDVRTEDNGKAIIIGVYTGHVVFSSFPAPWRPVIWFEVRPWGQGQIAFEIKMEAPGLEKPHVEKGAGVIGTEDGIVVEFKLKTIQVPGPGRLIVSMRPEGGRWTEVLSKQIQLAPTSASASRPPSWQSPTAAPA